MIIKLIWTSVMFLLIIGAVFFAALGFQIPESYYEESETFIVSAENSN